MDVETLAAIEALRDDINARFDRVDARLDRVEARLDRADARFDRIDSTCATKQELANVREELKRHTAVQTESIRDDIRIVAEGLAMLSTKFDARNR